MMNRFAWVVVLAPIQGCGRENWEEEKGRKGERQGWARGAILIPNQMEPISAKYNEKWLKRVYLISA